MNRTIRFDAPVRAALALAILLFPALHFSVYHAGEAYGHAAEHSAGAPTDGSHVLHQGDPECPVCNLHIDEGFLTDQPPVETQPDLIHGLNGGSVDTLSSRYFQAASQPRAPPILLTVLSA